MTRRYLRDLAERTVSTFAEAFIGFLLMDEAAGAISLDMLEKAGWAGLFAALAVLKGGLARIRGDRESAALTDTKVRSSPT